MEVVMPFAENSLLVIAVTALNIKWMQLSHGFRFSFYRNPTMSMRV